MASQLLGFDDLAAWIPDMAGATDDLSGDLVASGSTFVFSGSDAQPNMMSATQQQFPYILPPSNLNTTDYEHGVIWDSKDHSQAL
jgi:hypothetical protein